jgi:hypothetical protein
MSLNGEDKGAGMSSSEPTRLLSIRIRLCRTGSANTDFGIFPACMGRTAVKILKT